MDTQIEENGVGSLLDGFDTASYARSLDAIAELNGVADRCRETARREFDLSTVGGERYRNIYRRLVSR